ncbi:MAG: hypothetical protein ACI4K7_04555, partial [Oscillospiraceae bacterium]
NGTRKPDISPTIKFCCLNSDETLSLIDLVKQLDGYIPETVSGDKFQNIVVSDMIITICWKYQRLIAMIENSASLSLEDYGDMLEAIYHMLSDYIRIQIDYQLKIFMQRFKGYSFDTDYEEICRLAMGKSEEQDFWAVCDKKDGLYRPIERMNFIGRTRPL